MARKVFSIIAGVVTGFVFVFIGDATTNKVNDAGNIGGPAGSVTPAYMLVLVVIFWLVAAFFGGMVSARINRSEWKQSAVITSAILLGTALLSLALTPRPVAMWIAAILLYVPVGMLGGFLVKGKTLPAAIAQPRTRL